MEKTYSIEIVKEDRAVVQVDATSQEEAYRKAEEAIKEEGFKWSSKDNIISNIVGAKNKE